MIVRRENIALGFREAVRVFAVPAARSPWICSARRLAMAPAKAKVHPRVVGGWKYCVELSSRIPRISAAWLTTDLQGANSQVKRIIYSRSWTNASRCAPSANGEAA